jgi:MFS family permease
MSAVSEPPRNGISQPVKVLSLVSFLTDISSEMIYPLIPLFLTSTLGAPVAAVGLIEGIAESTASLTKAGCGWLSDRLRMRKPLVVLGYGLSALGKPLLAASQAWPGALGARFVDRLGKGVRTAPRDALIGDVTAEESRGFAFGFHRAADTLGAVAGPAIGLGLFVLLDENYRAVFLIAFIPAAAGVLVLGRLREHAPAASQQNRPRTPLGDLGARFYLFLGVSLLFAFGNSSDVFLILRAADLGLSDTAAVLAYVLFNATYALCAIPAGVASDRLGRRNVIALGFLVFSLVYLGFGLAPTAALVWPLFAAYGLYMALTEAVGKAFVVDFAPAATRGTALGIYTGATGMMVLVSSLTAGLLWDEVGPAAPFILGGVTAIASFLLLVLLLPRRVVGATVRP